MNHARMIQMETIRSAGIDVDEGMARMGCSLERYTDILNRFCRDLAPVPARIKDLVCQNNLKQAREENHSLKGSAGNLAAKDLFAASQSLEKAIDAKNADQINNYIFQVEQRFLEIKKSLENLQADTRTQKIFHPPDQKNDPEKMRTLLEALDANLAEFDPAESKISFDRFKEYLNSHVQDTGFTDLSQKLEDQIEIYQFEAARKLIKSFIQKL